MLQVEKHYWFTILLRCDVLLFCWCRIQMAYWPHLTRKLHSANKSSNTVCRLTRTPRPSDCGVVLCPEERFTLNAHNHVNLYFHRLIQELQEKSDLFLLDWGYLKPALLSQNLALFVLPTSHAEVLPNHHWIDCLRLDLQTPTISNCFLVKHKSWTQGLDSFAK